jgi:hypothetical protein
MWPSFETPRRGAAPQDEVCVCGCVGSYARTAVSPGTAAKPALLA